MEDREGMDALRELFRERGPLRYRRHPPLRVLRRYLEGRLPERLRPPEEVLEGLLEGRLPPEGWGSYEVAAHLRTCPRCQARLRWLRAFRSLWGLSLPSLALTLQPCWAMAMATAGLIVVGLFLSLYLVQRGEVARLSFEVGAFREELLELVYPMLAGPPVVLEIGAAQGQEPQLRDWERVAAMLLDEVTGYGAIEESTRLLQGAGIPKAAFRRARRGFIRATALELERTWEEAEAQGELGSYPSLPGECAPSKPTPGEPIVCLDRRERATLIFVLGLAWEFAARYFEFVQQALRGHPPAERCLEEWIETLHSYHAEIEALKGCLEGLR